MDAEIKLAHDIDLIDLVIKLELVARERLHLRGDFLTLAKGTLKHAVVILRA